MPHILRSFITLFNKKGIAGMVKQAISALDGYCESIQALMVAKTHKGWGLMNYILSLAILSSALMI